MRLLEAIEQYFRVVPFIVLYNVILHEMCVTIKLKATMSELHADDFIRFKF